MPQLVPFFFLNQVKFFLIVFGILLYLFSIYFLPKHLQTYLSRIYVTKIS